MNRIFPIAVLKDVHDNRLYFCVGDIYNILHDELEYMDEENKFLYDHHDDIKMINTHDIDHLYQNRFGKSQIEFVSLFGLLQLLDIYSTHKTAVTFIKWVMNTVVPCTYAHMANNDTKEHKDKCSIVNNTQEISKGEYCCSYEYFEKHGFERSCIDKLIDDGAEIAIPVFLAHYPEDNLKVLHVKKITKFE